MGSWTTLGPAVLSLAGVALGAAGTLVGQYLVSRANARQVEAQESAAHRAELKGVILKFLGVAFQVKKAVPAPSDADDSLEGLVEELWLAHAELDLAARTEPLRGAAYRFAARLTDASRSSAVDAAVLHRAQVEFMDAAYVDLWPGQRRDSAAL
ncbi:hypothetical protein [Streptomyces sp. NBC_00140]|uniref:hypothetical protein n=1 Tax=Streptomyces sp. NBC_00140 TaxID=2975664 RepID=UPI00224E6094|nr:hypothetical protein [Streptomyces sp. NBC_00140]MCX5329276.1 hypothetical protein [Streptomyces sp. NBC_00140]